MGSPSDDRARHRLFPHSGAGSDGAAAPEHVVFTTSLPDAYGDLDAEPLELVLDIPTPRPPVDEPTAWPLLGSPVDAPTVAIRHVVMPPPVDDDALYDHYYEPPAPAPGARWGFVLGGAVVVVCTVYIAVAGLGLLNPGSPASSALTTPRPTTTFSVPAVPPDGSTEPAPQAVVAGKPGVRGGVAVAPAAVPAADPGALAAPDPATDAAVDPAAVDAIGVAEATDQRAQGDVRRRGVEQTPRVATPPSGGPTASTSPAPGTQPPPGAQPSPGTSTRPSTTPAPTT